MTVSDEEAMLLAHKKTTSSSWQRLVVPAAVISLALGAVIATTLSTRSSRATSLFVLCNDKYNPPPGCGQWVGCIDGINDGNIHDSVQFWVQNRADCERFCGHISTWDTSQVTDMSKLFQNLPDFDDDISAWDTSGVTDMSNMFNDACTFNQPIDGWDVSQVRNMEGMFNCNNDVRVLDPYTHYFTDCTAFNQPLSSWDIRKVTNMYDMFFCASKFDQDLGWYVDRGVAEGMFGRSGCDKKPYPKFYGLDDEYADQKCGVHLVG